MIKKRKQRGYFKKVIFFIFLFAIFVVGVRQRDTVARYWTMLSFVVKRGDARALAFSLRHEPLGIFCITPTTLDAAEECYVFDMNGVVFGRARTVVDDVIVKIEEQSDIRPAMNMPFVPLTDWQNLRPILKAIRDKKITAGRVTLARTDRELTVIVLPHGIPFYFSYSLNPRDHLNALPEFQTKVSLEGLHSVDLRIEGRIFYR